MPSKSTKSQILLRTLSNRQIWILLLHVSRS